MCARVLFSTSLLPTRVTVDHVRPWGDWTRGQNIRRTVQVASKTPTLSRTLSQLTQGGRSSIGAQSCPSNSDTTVLCYRKLITAQSSVLRNSGERGGLLQPLHLDCSTVPRRTGDNVGKDGHLGAFGAQETKSHWRHSQP